ncbi:MAG: lipoic acid synthetase [Chloroflexi bacterium]|jgi:lipoic acid synthetase|nr:lipoic acid synthetase [Chloroflexota bacterium]
MASESALIDPAAEESAPHRRHPDWLMVAVPAGEAVRDLRRLVRGLHLNTVCEEARCPNLGECWDQRTATIMILGETCTRACGFCAVRTGRPTWHDPDEPRRVAEAVATLDLDHVVITSVARDDLADGGASVFAETIRRVRAASPATGIEVLVPDFDGEEAPLGIVVAAAPDLLDHNLETVERLQRQVRRRARYDRSLGVLARARARAREAGTRLRTKSSLMVGLGETEDEVLAAFHDLRAVGCDIVTVGQYLRPTRANLPVVRYWTPAEFARLRDAALSLGFEHVESGPLVRTSYHARSQVPGADLRAARRRAELDRDGRVVPGVVPEVVPGSMA